MPSRSRFATRSSTDARTAARLIAQAAPRALVGEPLRGRVRLGRIGRARSSSAAIAALAGAASRCTCSRERAGTSGSRRARGPGELPRGAGRVDGRDRRARAARRRCSATRARGRAPVRRAPRAPRARRAAAPPRRTVAGILCRCACGEEQLVRSHLVRDAAFARATLRARPCSPISPRAASRTRACSRRRRSARPSARGCPTGASPPSRTSGGGSRSSSTTGPCSRCPGVALLLDAGLAQSSRPAEEALPVIRRRSKRHRQTIRALRDLSFKLEPVVLRDQGFGTGGRGARRAVRARAPDPDRLDVDAAETLGEKAQAGAVPDHPRGAAGSIRRGPPTACRSSSTGTAGRRANARSSTTRPASAGADVRGARGARAHAERRPSRWISGDDEAARPSA